MNYIIYQEATGAIVKCLSCSPQVVELNTQPEEAWIASDRVEDTDFYIVDGAVVERPSLDVSVDGNVITGVPAGALLMIDGETYIADGEDIDFEPSIPGTYRVQIHLFPYKNVTLEVVA